MKATEMKFMRKTTGYT